MAKVTCLKLKKQTVNRQTSMNCPQNWSWHQMQQSVESCLLYGISKNSQSSDNFILISLSQKSQNVQTTVQSKPAGKMQLSSNTPLNEIHRLFNLQQQNKQNVKNTTAKERKAKLKALRSEVFARREDIMQAVNDDFRKPHSEVELGEIAPVIMEIKNFLANLDEWMRPKAVETPLSLLGTSSKVIYEPKGSILSIYAWNYPFQFAGLQIVSAVGAGNCIILKPSEYTPNTSAVVKQIVKKVFNENEVAVVEGDYTVSQELFKLKFDHFSFIGSPNVGKLVMKAAAEHLASVTLELGGKSPAIVDETANIRTSAKRIVWGKYLAAGQNCISPDYVLVHESKYDELIASLKWSIAQFFGDSDDAIKQSPDYSRIITTRHQERTKKLIEDAIERGANVATGCKIDDSENYISPTVLTDVSLDSDIMREEIFGPVLPVLKFRDLKEALALVNSKEKPLAMYIFSRKQKNIDAILHNTSAGGTCVNETMLHYSQPNLPFGGVNNSGFGSMHGYWGFKDFSHERAVLTQHLGRGGIENMYPPYKGIKPKLIKFAAKYL